MSRKVVLLTIGAEPLPEVTPIVPVATTVEVATWEALTLAPPANVALAVTLDGGVLTWDAALMAGGYVVQTSPDDAGAPTTWGDHANTDKFTRSLRFDFPAVPMWVRVLTQRDGRRSLPSSEALLPAVTGVVAGVAPASESTITRENCTVWFDVDGEVKLGNLQINYGSAWKSGAAITYTASAGSPATATISVTAGVFVIGGREYGYDASSVNVSGTGGTTETFWLYYEDPGLSAGAKTLHANTDGRVTYNSNSRVIVGAVQVAFPASGSGSGGGTTPGGNGPGGGGGGGWCPDVMAFVLRREADGTPVLARAGDIVPGDFLLLRSMRWGRVTAAQHEMQPRVTIHGQQGGALTCSVSAPIGCFGGGVVSAAEAFDHTADCLIDGRAVGNYIHQVQPQPDGLVACLTVENDFFWAGDTAEYLFAHHNIKQMEP